MKSIIYYLHYFRLEDTLHTDDFEPVLHLSVQYICITTTFDISQS